MLWWPLPFPFFLCLFSFGYSMEKDPIRIDAIAVSSERPLVATAYTQNNSSYVEIWNIATNKNIHLIKSHKTPRALTFCEHDSKLAYVTRVSPFIYLWDRLAPNHLQFFGYHKETSQLRSSKAVLASLCLRGIIKIWNLIKKENNPEPTLIRTIEYGPTIMGISFFDYRPLAFSNTTVHGIASAGFFGECNLNRPDHDDTYLLASSCSGEPNLSMDTVVFPSNHQNWCAFLCDGVPFLRYINPSHKHTYHTIKLPENEKATHLTFIADATKLIIATASRRLLSMNVSHCKKSAKKIRLNLKSYHLGSTIGELLSLPHKNDGLLISDEKAQELHLYNLKDLIPRRMKVVLEKHQSDSEKYREQSTSPSNTDIKQLLSCIALPF